MRNRYTILPALALLLCSFCAAGDAHATDPFYTIQAGTFSLTAAEHARKHARLMSEKLGEEDGSDVRVEEGSKYYIVRVGRFSDIVSAQKVFSRVKALVDDAFILKAPAPDKAKDQQAKGRDERPAALSDEYFSLQSGKYGQHEAAREAFESLAERLAGTDIDNLRVVQSGDTFRIRVGRFPAPSAAEEFRKTAGDDPVLTSMVRVRAREERIVDRYFPVSRKNTPGSAPEKPGADTAAGQRAEKVQVNTDKEMLDRLFNDVSSYYGSQEYGKAAEIIRKGLARWPDNPDLHAWYGASLLATGFPDKAYEAYRKAATLQPEVPEYHSGAGHSLLDTHIDRARLSVDAFKKALTIDPNNSGALEGLGILYVSTGRKYLASDVYERLKQIDQAAADRLNQFILYGLDWGDSR